MKYIMFLLAGSLGALPLEDQSPAPAPEKTGDDCIEDGQCATLQFDRPPLGEPGDPVGAGWTCGTGKPEAWEDDWSSRDDDMGPASPSAGGETADVEVCNDGGDLSGPNGVDQNGGLEGDCIEVKVCWSYDYLEQREVHGFIAPGGIGPGGGSTVMVHARDTKCSETQDAIPC